MIKIKLKDGSVKEAQKGTSVFEVTKAISEGLARAALCAAVNEKIVDMTYKIEEDCSLTIFTFNDEQGRMAYWHTTSHILAQAVKRLFPDVKLAIGPSIENGFYYDFDTKTSITLEGLTQIEAEMKKIVKENLPLIRSELSREDAIKFFSEKNETYKVELINDLPIDAKISIYQQGEFTDLCAGPHLYATGSVKAFKLLSVTGAYWRGNEKNKMLQRIYGISFQKASEVEEYIQKLEENKKRDHNKLGRELEIFMTSELVGQGLPLLMPKGAKIVQTLQRFVEDEEEKRGYVRTKTPFMGKSDLYKVSGHWDHYKDSMFVLGDEEKDDEILGLRPMTCPYQFLIYNAKPKSYRDLPMRYGETSSLFRNEASGEMHGLIRVRQFTISEGHIVCMPEQLEDEFKNVVDLVNFMMKTLGIENDVWYRFSQWDPDNKEKYIGSAEAWEDTQDKMRNILDHLGIEYKEAKGEAAFYGPKLDIQTKNVYGKEDTIITIQIDFSLAERFSMFYIDKDNTKKHPYIIHRTSIGCYERTLAILIEKYAGAFPTWIAPVQVKVIPVSDLYLDYAKKVTEELLSHHILVELDKRSEKVGYKIREAQLEKVPYMLIVGEKEQENQTISVRSRKDGDKGESLVCDFIKNILEEIEQKVN